MKPLKRLACLVTLSCIAGLTLQADEPIAYRQWTDPSGRTMTARYVESLGTDTIKIERQDGQVFTVPLKAFSPADQAYVKSLTALPQKPKLVLPAGLKAADPALWALLANGGNQPASTYSNTGLDLVLESLNQRFTVNALKTSAGQPLQVRTEPDHLAGRIKLSGEMPRMTVATFMKEIARANNLLVATDAKGMIVLLDKTPAADLPEHEFLGVKVSQN